MIDGLIYWLWGWEVLEEADELGYCEDDESGITNKDNTDK